MLIYSFTPYPLFFIKWGIGIALLYVESWNLDGWVKTIATKLFRET